MAARTQGCQARMSYALAAQVYGTYDEHAWRRSGWFACHPRGHPRRVRGVGARRREVEAGRWVGTRETSIASDRVRAETTTPTTSARHHLAVHVAAHPDPTPRVPAVRAPTPIPRRSAAQADATAHHGPPPAAATAMTPRTAAMSARRGAFAATPTGAHAPRQVATTTRGRRGLRALKVMDRRPGIDGRWRRWPAACRASSAA
jgi:hypothetical protein